MLKRIKNVVVNAKTKIVKVMGLMAMACVMAPQPVYAAVASYTAPITKVVNVIISIGALAGLAVLAYGIYTFAISFKKRDQNGEFDAINTFIVAGILLGGSALLAVLKG